MRRSPNTLLGRVHRRVELEVRHDVRGLYELIDPVVRARLEEQPDDEPDATLAAIRAQVQSVRTAEVEEVEILDARKVSERHGGRPAAIVRSVVRYNERPVADEFRTTWVRDRGAWYSTEPGAAHLLSRDQERLDGA